MELTSAAVAPYWRFSATPQLSDRYPGGTYTALITGCEWQTATAGCEHCWSRGGWDGIPPRRELTPAEAANRLELGMRSLGLQACRITGGEPTVHWDHLIAVAGDILHRPAIPRATLIVETHGADLTNDRIAELHTVAGDALDRVVLTVGLKATSPTRLGELTGLDAMDAERTHTRQLSALFRAARAGFDVIGTFIDRFTEPDVFAAIRAELNRVRAGAGDALQVAPFVKHRGWTAAR